MATVRPIDHEAIIAAARETHGIVTAEEHTIYGGLGGAVAEVVVTTHPVPMRILGFPGVFAPHRLGGVAVRAFRADAGGDMRCGAGVDECVNGRAGEWERGRIGEWRNHHPCSLSPIPPLADS